MKKQQPTQTPKYTCCTPRQKFLALVALGGLFACGLMIGVTINGKRPAPLVLQAEQCEALLDEISSTISHTWGDFDLARLEELNQKYSKNCAGYVSTLERENRAPDAEISKLRTCTVIEKVLLRDVRSEDSRDSLLHAKNLTIYKKLLGQGCPENAEKYRELIKREMDIMVALAGAQFVPDDRQTCEEIELLLEQHIITDRPLDDSEVRIARAKVFAQLAEHGCAENAVKYTDLAARELEIARALRDDKFDEHETTEVVETYKRLEMKQQAKEVLNKVQKLTDPAIDFILQIQKIIEE